MISSTHLTAPTRAASLAKYDANMSRITPICGGGARCWHGKAHEGDVKNHRKVVGKFLLSVQFEKEKILIQKAISSANAGTVTSIVAITMQNTRTRYNLRYTACQMHGWLHKNSLYFPSKKRGMIPFKTNHDNIVKAFGCLLEKDTPFRLSHCLVRCSHSIHEIGAPMPKHPRHKPRL